MGLPPEDGYKPTMHGLEPLSPSEGVQSYETARESEVSQSTLYEHKTRLNRFTEWCEKEARVIKGERQSAGAEAAAIVEKAEEYLSLVDV